MHCHLYTQANGHGRALKHVIKEVKPYNLTRFCVKVNQTEPNVSSTPTPDASTLFSGAPQPTSTGTGAVKNQVEEDLCEEGVVTYRFRNISVRRA